MYTTLQMIEIYFSVINHVNHDLKYLCQWLRSNKISLNASKTKIICKHKQMVITKHMNFGISGQKINTTTSVKYLGVYLNDSLTWETHFKNLIPKLNTPVSAEPRVYLGILFTGVTINLD